MHSIRVQPIAYKIHDEFHRTHAEQFFEYQRLIQGHKATALCPAGTVFGPFVHDFNPVNNMDGFRASGMRWYANAFD